MHEVEGERDVVDHLVDVFRCEVELVQGHEEPAEQAHQKTQINAVLKVRAQVDHLEVQLVQMLVDERHQRLLHHLQLLRCVVEESIEGVSLAAHADIVIRAGDRFLVFPKIKMKKLRKFINKIISRRGFKSQLTRR